MEFNTFPVILEGWQAYNDNPLDPDAAALHFAQNFAFDECGDATVQNIGYSEYVGRVGDVSVYRDYGADYYFFTDESLTDDQ